MNIYLLRRHEELLEFDDDEVNAMVVCAATVLHARQIAVEWTQSSEHAWGPGSADAISIGTARPSSGARVVLVQRGEV